MATKRMIAREKVRRRLSENQRVAREALKEIISDKTIDYDERMQAVLKLNKRPRDESQSRCRNRCTICGRSRSIYRKFNLCRLCIRKALMFGYVPGAKKASW